MSKRNLLQYKIKTVTGKKNDPLQKLKMFQRSREILHYIQIENITIKKRKT